MLDSRRKGIREIISEREGGGLLKCVQSELAPPGEP